MGYCGADCAGGAGATIHLPVLVVDDGSRDETAAAARAAGASVVRHPKNRSKGAGMQTLEGAILLIVLGAFLILKPWFEKRQLFGKAEES